MNKNFYHKFTFKVDTKQILFDLLFLRIANASGAKDVKGNSFCFFTCYLGAPQPTLEHYQGDSLTNLMLIECIYVNFRLKEHRVPCNKVGSLSPVKHLVEFEPGAF